MGSTEELSWGGGKRRGLVVKELERGKDRSWQASEAILSVRSHSNSGNIVEHKVLALMEFLL